LSKEGSKLSRGGWTLFLNEIPLRINII